LWLLTLVDVRWLWWQIPCPKLNITQGTTWQQVITTLGTALGRTIFTDTIDSRFLNPHPKLNCLEGEPIPIVLDTVAFNIGQRFTIDYVGNLKMMTPQTALTTRNNDDITNASISSGMKPPDDLAAKRTIIGGGDSFGPIPAYIEPIPLEFNRAPNFRSSLLPTNVYVRYRGKLCSSVNEFDQAPLYWSTTYPLSSSTQFSRFNGNGKSKVFHDLATASFTAGRSTPDNQQQLTDLASAVANAYWGWKGLMVFDRMYGEVIPFAVEGLTDTIEWTYREGGRPNRFDFRPPTKGNESVESLTPYDLDEADVTESTTRVFTSPWNWEPEELHHIGQDCISGDQWCGPPDIIKSGGINPVKCATLYQELCDGLPAQKVGSGCCHTVCCSSSSSSSTSVTDQCPTFNCEKCAGGASCQIILTINCLAGGVDCGTGPGLSCATMNLKYFLNHVPGLPPGACTWTGCGRLFSDISRCVNGTDGKPQFIATVYHNGSEWQADVIDRICGNQASFKSLPTDQCWNRPGLTLNLVPGGSCIGSTSPCPALISTV
jgi:hypothetical protein